MMYAIDARGDRIEAVPGAAGNCPACESPLAPKCGQIVAWHWAHRETADCDPWAEPDNAWHREWQQRVPAERREVTRGPHRADVITAGGTVVELQHSSISPAEIAEREEFYGRMVWLFDATGPYGSGRLRIRNRMGKHGSYQTFRWEHPRKTVAACRKPVYLDLGDSQVLRVRAIHPDAPCGGWGQIGSGVMFTKWLNREETTR